MTPRIPLLLLTAALFVAGCGQSRSVEAVAPPTAATITGGPSGEAVEVPRAEVEEVVAAVTDSENFRLAVFQGTLPDGFRQTVLTQLIHVEVMEQLLAEQGVEVTDAERQEVQQLLTDELTGLMEQAGVDAGADEVMGEIDPYVELLVRRNALLAALGGSLSEGATQEVVCARHILVEDAAVAEDLLAQLGAGADFEQLASENSIDPGSGAAGGDLGCAPPSRYVPEFAEAVESAPLDEVVGPVQTQFGLHLITVYDRRTEEVPGEALQVAGQALQEQLGEVDVSVSDDLGQWDPQTQAVLPA